MFGKKKKPVLSVIVAFYNMEREAPRTLYTLSVAYQRGVNESDYEVIAVDCGSDTPLDEAMVRSFGKQFRLVRMPPNPAPAASINRAAMSSRGELITICIDGARMLSPGILRLTLASFQSFKNPVTATISMHLGPGLQKKTILEGYNSTVEDQLLESSNWRRNGYELFRISTLAESSENGWFCHIHESNCLTVRRDTFRKLGGLDERFISAGGGLVNLDYYKRAVQYCNESVLLLGECTFHQIHGGVATNSTDPDVALPFLEEYQNIRKMPFSSTEKTPLLFGSVTPESGKILSNSAEKFREMHQSISNNE
jgi:glycosyltransferase involved in cell wall biosynthesis